MLQLRTVLVSFGELPYLLKHDLVSVGKANLRPSFHAPAMQQVSRSPLRACSIYSVLDTFGTPDGLRVYIATWDPGYSTMQQTCLAGDKNQSTCCAAVMFI